MVFSFATNFQLWGPHNIQMSFISITQLLSYLCVHCAYIFYLFDSFAHCERKITWQCKFLWNECFLMCFYKYGKEKKKKKKLFRLSLFLSLFFFLYLVKDTIYATSFTFLVASNWFFRFFIGSLSPFSSFPNCLQCDMLVFVWAASKKIEPLTKSISMHKYLWWKLIDYCLILCATSTDSHWVD